MNMAYVLLAAAVIAAIAAAAFLMLRKKESSLNADGDDQKNGGQKGQGQMQGDQELYRLGMEHVSDKPIMYALTTCQHCRNTRKFLDESHAQYTCIYLDEFDTDQRHELMEVVRTYNPRGTFPTILFPNGKVIVGYRRQLLLEALDGSRETA